MLDVLQFFVDHRGLFIFIPTALVVILGCALGYAEAKSKQPLKLVRSWRADYEAFRDGFIGVDEFLKRRRNFRRLGR